MDVRYIELDPSYWTVAGSDLSRLQLCNFVTKFFNVNPRKIDDAGGDKSTTLSELVIDTELTFVTASRVDLNAADDLLDTSWASFGWTVGNFTTWLNELKTWAINNFDGRPLVNPNDDDMNLVVVRGDIDGQNYHGAFLYFGNNGTLL